MAATQVFANDSVARYGAGGIELIKSEHIRMISEELEISAKTVKVTYRFLNESANDVHTTVAFPFPSDSHPLSVLYVPGAEALETMAETFRVHVNGTQVKTKLERKAVVEGRDITNTLRKLGLSDNDIFFDVRHEELLALVERLESLRAKFGTWWKVQTTAYWEQVFPAGREVVVEHSYTPAAGGGYAELYKEKYPEDFERDIDKLWTSFTGKTDRHNEDCLDQMTKRAIERRVTKLMSNGSDAVRVSYESVQYILRTARNWKGPIGDFRLRLVKGSPDQFVSLCFPGKPVRISPTVYEFRQKDFVPQQDLIVYFYEVH